MVVKPSLSERGSQMNAYIRNGMIYAIYVKDSNGCAFCINSRLLARWNIVGFGDPNPSPHTNPVRMVARRIINHYAVIKGSRLSKELKNVKIIHYRTIEFKMNNSKRKGKKII
jgi:hypothetical protein